MTFTDWYRGRRALVIGGFGYIGSDVAAALVDAGAQVTIVTGSFVADITRIGAELDWRPTVALVDGLRRTVAASVAESANR